MPQDFAEKLAAQLLAHSEDSPIVVNVPNHGFNERVVQALEALGCRVERSHQPGRLTVHRPEPRPAT